MGRLSVAELAGLIRDIPDVPQPGIVFKDITPLLAHPDGLASTIEALADPWRDAGIDTVVGIEARGFILGAAVAHSQQYDLEYGTDTIEIHADAVSPREHVLVLDDVLATGGTAAAAALLLRRLGATVAGCSFLLELSFLDGRAKLGDARIETVIEVGG